MHTFQCSLVALVFWLAAGLAFFGQADDTKLDRQQQTVCPLSDDPGGA